MVLEGLLVALGAAIGAPIRWWLGQRLDGTFPSGTLAANLIGSLALGLSAGWAFSGALAAWWTTGLCGALTTYSTFAVQVADRPGSRGWAYAALSVGGGVAAAALGFALTR